MRPHIVRHLGLADVITVANALIGFLATLTALIDPTIAARLILLAAMGDGLDGIVARYRGSTALGEYLDSLSDVAAFGVAPATVVVAVTHPGWPLAPPQSPIQLVPFLVAAVFLAMAVVRLGFYTAHDAHSEYTNGVPTTLAATIIAAAVLAGVTNRTFIIVTTIALAYLMIASVRYPDLLPRDTFFMGTVHGLAIAIPTWAGRAFPYALLSLALAYLTLAPRFYWRTITDTESSNFEPDPRSP